jgi:ABC-type glycerol-3-phosphate transport system permease component
MIKAKRVLCFRQSLIYMVLALALVWTLFPLWMAFVLSIKHPLDFFTAKALPFVQFQPTLDHWRYEWDAFDDPAGMGHGLANSLIVAIASSIVSLALGSLAAFGLTLRRRKRRLIWPLVVFFLFPRILPPVITVFPFTTIMHWLGLADTLPALVVAHTTLALPLAILILYSTIAELPTDLLDAVLIDGCGLLDSFRLVIVPLLLPVLLATGALCFAQSWNEFIYALMNVQQAQTAPLAVASLLNKDGIEFEYVGSHLLMVILPPLLLALLARRHIVRGLSLGMLKDELSK